MKVLAVGAHPDDIEIGCGGTIAKLIASGAKVDFICLTSGEEGAMDSTDLAKLREQEAEKAAKILKVKQVHFLRFPDGMMHLTKDMKLKVIQKIRELKPDMVFTHASHDPVPDHSLCHQLVKNAVDAAAGPWFPDAGRSPWSVATVLGFEVWSAHSAPDVHVDIGAFLETKEAALKAHKSQVESVNYIEGIKGLASYRGTFSKTAAYAEAFEMIKIDGRAFLP